MRKVFVVLALLVMLSGCAGPVPMPTPTVTFIPATATLTLPTSTPTEIPKPTEVVETNIIDVTRPSAEWDLSSLPEEKRTAIEHWLADPYNSTLEEKKTADGFLTKQWQLTLKTDAIDHVLYEQIVQYIQGHGGEAGLIPNSLHQKLLTDKSNMVLYHAASGMDPYVHFSWFGFGTGLSNPNMSYLETRASKIQQIDFYGTTIIREGENYPITPDVGIEGDLVAIFELPNLKPDIAIGAIIALDGGFTEVQVHFEQDKTTKKDVCIMFIGDQSIGQECGENISIPATKVTPFRNQSKHYLISKSKLLNILGESNGKMHIVVTHGNFSHTPMINDMWSNGFRVVTGFILYEDILIP